MGMDPFISAVSMAIVNAYFWLRYKRRNILCIWADPKRELFSNWQHDFPRSNGHGTFCEHREACIGIGEHREHRWRCWHLRFFAACTQHIGSQVKALSS
jgi:hypothetical protein